MKPIVENLNEEDWSSLHKMCLGVYLEGSCYEFAVAVSRGMGSQMLGVMDGKTVRHVVVKGNDGRFRDARGFVKRSELGKPFGIKPPYVLEPVTKGMLQKIRPLNNFGIDRAALMAETLWPNWPWDMNCLRPRVIAFLTALDGLCKKHGLFIRATDPMAKPLIDQRAGDERFKVEPLMTGQYTFDRHLKGTSSRHRI